MRTFIFPVILIATCFAYNTHTADSKSNKLYKKIKRFENEETVEYLGLENTAREDTHYCRKDKKN